MSWLPTFSVWQFAAAGAIAAAGPILIHLLNRRRYKTVQWAAMDFLREAVQRNRRWLEWRDLLLMLLRALALLMFGLALARPFFASPRSTNDDRQPLHAIVLLDNSLSMGYESFGGTLLDRAKIAAGKYLEKLPSGSRVTLLPTCGMAEAFTLDAYASPEAAREAIQKISVVARSTSLRSALNEAKQAEQQLPQMAKRYVLFSDQQLLNWDGLSSSAEMQALPALQLINIAPDMLDNSWISDLRLADSVADIETPAQFIVEVRHVGGNSRENVPVSLWVNGEEVASKVVTLESGAGAREIEFEYAFNRLVPEPGRPQFATVKATLANDKLPADDTRYLVVPVVAELPVVFIDQYGASQEDVIKNRVGETRPLRKLLAPVHSRNEQRRAFIKVIHLASTEVTQEVLSTARAVVMAGVAQPNTELLTMLQEYATQGGQVFIAAGANFDAESWNISTLPNGRSLLPYSLRTDVLGAIPELAKGEVKPFYLSYESMAGQELFQLPGVADDRLRDLFTEPFFFKAVDARLTPEEEIKVLTQLRQYIEQQQKTMAQIRAIEAGFLAQEKNMALSVTEQEARHQNLIKMQALQPQWLTWSSSAEFPAVPEWPTEEVAQQKLIDQLVEQQRARVLARFTSEQGPPFLISQQQGRGRVVFCTTGIASSSSWNTLSNNNAMLLFDRLLRSMLLDTLPTRNYDPREQISLVLPQFEPEMSVSLARPNQVDWEPLEVGFIGHEQRGVQPHGFLQAGVYTIRAERESTATNATTAENEVLWEIPLAVNAPAEESELEPLPPVKFKELAQDSSLKWLEEQEEISLAGATITGQHLWWYGVCAVLFLLLAEMITLTWSSWFVGSSSLSQAISTR
jgi:Aerotolerance regulator N-terminal/von Willebrand factor type A domain